MTIKWYRGAGKRVLTPRRDKPTAPKDKKPKKPKKIGRPRSPGVEKPQIIVPFIKAYRRDEISRLAFRANMSLSGLDAIRKIASRAQPPLSLGETTWVYSGEKSGDCSRYGDEPAYACPVLASKGPWPTLDSFIAFTPPSRVRYRKTKNGPAGGAVEKSEYEVGLWGKSHLNCTCYISVKMFDKSSPSRYAVFEVYTDPAQGSDRPGGTSSLGYAYVEGSIPMDILLGNITTDEAEEKSGDDSGAAIVPPPPAPTPALPPDSTEADTLSDEEKAAREAEEEKKRRELSGEPPAGGGETPGPQAPGV
jgi:hypothetical protein